MARAAPGASAARDPGPEGAMTRFLNGYYRVLQVAITILMAGLLVPVTMQVLSRYTGIIPRYVWTEEIARFCFVWIVMIGAMIAVRDRTHFIVDVLPPPRTPLGRLVADMTVHFCLLVFALVFLVYGYQWARFGATQRSEIAELPMLIIYIAWPLAAFTWILFIGEHVVQDIRRYRDETRA
jgi:TRAP-type transport system small permease protein